MASDLNMTTRETTRQFNRSHGSFELAFAPVILALVGLWIDRRLGTTPAFVITLAVLGFVGVGLKLYYAYRYEMAGHAQKLAAIHDGTVHHGTRQHVTVDPGTVTS